MQTEINSRKVGYPGQKANSTPDSGRKADALAAMLFGVLCVFSNPEMTNCSSAQAQKITLSADLITANVISGNVVINGEANSVTVTYADSHSASMTALKGEIEDLDSDLIVTVSGRTLSVTCNTKDVYLQGFAVASGATQATISYDIVNKIAGLSKFAHKERNAGDTVTVIQRGEYLALCEDTDIDPNKDDVYVRIVPETGKTLGAVKKSSDSGKAVKVSNVRFASTESDNVVTLALNI